MLYEVKLEDYIRFCHDVYFPEVDKLYPEIRLIDQKNIPIDGFYKDSFLQKEHGWTRKKESLPDETGFYAAFYVRENIRDEQTGVIAFRGSDDIYDFFHHDLKIAHNEWPQVFEKAKSFYLEIMEENKIKNLSFTGHSLGGALAQLMAIYANKNEYAHNNRPAICFNAPQMGYLEYYNKIKSERVRTAIDFGINDLKNKLKGKKEQNKDCHQLIDDYLKKHNNSEIFLQAAVMSVSCDAKYGDLYSLDKVKNLLSSLTVQIKEVYQRMAHIKDLAACIKHDQPAFNSIYHLVTKNPSKREFNIESFTEYYEKLVNTDKYKYIFNFNSFFDLVHCCGMPIGNQVSIDIDDAKYAKEWGATDEDRQLRMQAELRAFLTLQPEYFSGAKEIISLNNCRIDIQKEVLGKVSADKVTYPKIISEAIKYKLDGRWDKEAAYYTTTQHSMFNLGKAMLSDQSLYSINFGNFYSAKTAIKNYSSNNPKEKFDDSFHLKISQLIVDAKLDYFSCRRIG